MSAATATCPAWCSRQPEFEPAGTHESERWQEYGLSVVLSMHPEYENQTTVEVDNGPSQSLSLTEVQAHELGTQLVRSADRLRRARIEAQG